METKETTLLLPASAAESLQQQVKETGKPIGEIISEMAEKFVLPSPKLWRNVRFQPSRKYIQGIRINFYGKDDNRMKRQEMQQVHSRFTKPVYEKMQNDAAALGLSVSQYIAFMSMTDMQTISAKMDKIAETLTSLEQRVQALEDARR